MNKCEHCLCSQEEPLVVCGSCYREMKQSVATLRAFGEKVDEIHNGISNGLAALLDSERAKTKALIEKLRYYSLSHHVKDEIEAIEGARPDG